jgi:hypothetical protein
MQSIKPRVTERQKQESRQSTVRSTVKVRIVSLHVYLYRILFMQNIKWLLRVRNAFEPNRWNIG